MTKHQVTAMSVLACVSNQRTTLVDKQRGMGGSTQNACSFNHIYVYRVLGRGRGGGGSIESLKIAPEKRSSICISFKNSSWVVIEKSTKCRCAVFIIIRSSFFLVLRLCYYTKPIINHDLCSYCFYLHREKNRELLFKVQVTLLAVFTAVLWALFELAGVTKTFALSFCSAAGGNVEEMSQPFTLSPTIVKIETEDSSEDDVQVWPATSGDTAGVALPGGSLAGQGDGSDFIVATFGNIPSGSREGSKRFRCPKCGAGYAQSGSLGRHRRKCEGLFALVCKFCSHVFHRKDRYREHLLSKHDHIDPDLGPPGYTLPPKF